MLKILFVIIDLEYLTSCLPNLKSGSFQKVDIPSFFSVWSVEFSSQDFFGVLNWFKKNNLGFVFISGCYAAKGLCAS